MTEGLLEKIKSRGYWKVIIRPESFKENLIRSLEECDRIVNDSVVRLRGWDYPHCSGMITRDIDYIEDRVDWNFFHEIWRFYQSGQFVHLRGLAIDWQKGVRGEPSLEPGEALSYLGTLYTITEIYSFASRLVEKLELESPVYIYINLVNAKGRKIVTLDPRRFLPYDYVSQLEEIPRKITIGPSNLIANSAELAIEHVVWLFERFNWTKMPRQVFIEDQKKFLERRI